MVELEPLLTEESTAGQTLPLLLEAFLLQGLPLSNTAKKWKKRTSMQQGDTLYLVDTAE